MSFLKSAWFKFGSLAIMVGLAYVYSLQAGEFSPLVFVLALLFFVAPAFIVIVVLGAVLSVAGARQEARVAEKTASDAPNNVHRPSGGRDLFANFLVKLGLILALAGWGANIFAMWEQLNRTSFEWLWVVIPVSLSYAMPGLGVMLLGFKLRAKAA